MKTMTSIMLYYNCNYFIFSTQFNLIQHLVSLEGLGPADQHIRKQTCRLFCSTQPYVSTMNTCNLWTSLC